MNDWPCIHRGEPTGETFNCGCGLGPQTIYACNLAALGGLCVVRMGKPAIKEPKSCMRCNFREAPKVESPKRVLPKAGPRPPGTVLPYDERRRRQAEQRRKQAALHDCENPPRPIKSYGGAITRHLIYYIYPVRGNGVWQRNVEHLLRRIDLFNGRRIVAIATGDELEPAEDVQAAFGSHVNEYLLQPNNKRLGEVAAFVPMLERIGSRSPSECTFYAHAKGVTRQVNDRVTVHRWADLMYESLLDHWPLIEQLLEQYPIAGSFKKVGRGFAGSTSDWHYSGTFFWMRNSEVFSRDWRRVDQQYGGVEAWPGVHFATDEGACVFGKGRVPGLNLYDYQFFQNDVLPAYQAWIEANNEKAVSG